jgi:hypothetical protein
MSRSNAREHWVGVIAAQQCSGLNVASWCSQNNVAANSFYIWRKRLTEGSFSQAVPQFINQSGCSAPLPAHFMELRMKSSQDEISIIHLKIGAVSVAVPTGFDPRLLSQILDLLESR